MPSSDVVIVSASARALVRSARRAGLRASAVDGFGDVDTCDRAERWCRLPSDGDGVDGRMLPAVVDALAAGGAAVIVGSGLEAAADVIEAIAARHALAGNAAAVWRTVGDAGRWFETLARLGIPHPEVRRDPPADAAGWLCKRAASSGGRGVRAADAADLRGPAREGWYFQRRVDGPVCSLLFLADGARICAVGFNRLLPAPPAAGNPFAWGGAVRTAGLPEGLRIEVEAAAAALTRTLGLRGLNGLDFVVDGDQWQLLELNPRPTATVELWDVDPMPPLLDLHLRACSGRLPEGSDPFGAARGTRARAMAVVYAAAPLRVPRDVRWSGACRDLPRPGLRIRAGDPICTVHAADATPAGAEQRVLGLRDAVPARLSRRAASAGRTPPWRTLRRDLSTLPGWGASQ